MFCAPRLIFGGIEGVGFLFHVLLARTHFRRFRGRRVTFSRFALPDSFSAVPRASGPVFMFCASGLVFSGVECVGSLFHVLRSRTHFRRYRGRRVPFSGFARRTRFRWYRERRVPFSCFALPDSFSAVPRTSGPVLMFCATGLVFDSTEGVGSRLHVMRTRTRFRRYRGRRVSFSCFACLDSFSAVPRASCPIFMFYAARLVFGGTEGVVSRFHVVPARAHFRRYRGRRFPFSSIARPDSFSAVPRASGPVFLFCAPGLVFDGSEGVRSRFHVLCPELIFGGTEGVGFRFNVLRVRICFRRYRGRRARFDVLRARTRFRR
jgi:hypothetical protein